MVWVSRVAVALIVAAYAGWLGGPLLAPFDGAAAGDAWRTAVALALKTPWPHAAFWITSILFYVAAAVLTLIGSGRAALFFLIGFMTEVLLRLTLNQHGPGGPADVSARAMEALAPLGLGLDPVPLTLAALAILGLVVYGLDQRRVGPARRRSGPNRRPGRRNRAQDLAAEHGAEPNSAPI